MNKVWCLVKGKPACLMALKKDYRLSLKWCGLDPTMISLNGMGNLVGHDGITKRTWGNMVREAFDGEDDVGTAGKPLEVAAVWGPSKVSMEFRKRGSSNKKPSTMVMYLPCTFAAVTAFLQQSEASIRFEDVNLYVPSSTMPLDAERFSREVEGHATSGTPLRIEWESASKAIAALTPDDGLKLLGLPEEYTIWIKDAPLAAVDYTEPLPESLREEISMWAACGCATIDGLFNHFAQDVFLRQRDSPDPAMVCKGDTTRELISPVLHCAASLVPETLVRANKNVRGRRSHGTVDYVLDHQGISVICIEANLHDQTLDHLGQLCGAIRAEHDALRSKVLGKRKYDGISLSSEEQDSLGKLKKMLTFALLTSLDGVHYRTFKYMEDPLEMVQFERLTMPGSMGTPDCKFPELKQCMIRIVRHLMSLLESQIKDAAEYLPAECSKKKAKH